MKSPLIRIVTILAFSAGILPMIASTSYSIEVPKTLHDKFHVPNGLRTPLPFTATDIGVNWQGNGAAPEIRTSTNGFDFTAWRSVAVSHDMSNDEEGAYAALVPGEDARFVEVRATEGVDLSSIEVSPINTRDGPRRKVTVMRTAAAATPQPNVISRAAWGADEGIRRGSPSYSRIKKLFVHHTVTQNNDTDPAARIRAIYAMHVQSNGWNDIGYNFLVDAWGNVYEGRYARAYEPGEIPTGENRNGLGVIGAHASQHNTYSTGIALLGDFRTTGPNADAAQALVEVLAWKADRHGIDVHSSDLYTNGSISAYFPNIAGHRDTGDTQCPGDQLYAQLPSIRDRVQQRIDFLSGLSAPSMPAGTQMLPASLSRDLTPNATGAVSRSAVRVDVIFDGTNPLADRTISVPANGRSFSLSDAHYGPLHLAEDTYSIRAVAYDTQGRASPAAPVADSYVVTTGPVPATGYWVQGSDGGIFSYGSAGFFGSMGGRPLAQPVVGMAATRTSQGYWMVASDGGIFAFGDAGFHGSMGGRPLARPVVGMAATPSGNGYWMVASDGGIFAFGDAPFHGSMGGRPLAQPVVGMAVTPSGNGYWMVASDGGIFAFGDAPFHGSMGGRSLAQPVIAMAAPTTRDGYWMVGADGGIFAFGDAGYHGSLPGRGITSGASSIAPTFTGRGYWIVGRNGQMYSFGDAPFYGSPPDGGFRITARGAAAAR